MMKITKNIILLISVLIIVMGCNLHTVDKSGEEITSVDNSEESRGYIRQSYIDIYEHADYKGEHHRIYVKPGDVINLPGKWNNRVSSIKLTYGWKYHSLNQFFSRQPFSITLFNGYNGTGIYCNIDRDTDLSLGWEGFNDLTTSITVSGYADTKVGKYIEVYTKPDFKGRKKRIECSSGSWKPTGVFYKTISSIKVFGAADVYLYGDINNLSLVRKGNTNLKDIGFDNKITEIVFNVNPRHHAVLYEGHDYTGNYRVVRRDTVLNTVDFNDKTSSIQIIRSLYPIKFYKHNYNTSESISLMYNYDLRANSLNKAITLVEFDSIYKDK